MEVKAIELQAKSRSSEYPRRRTIGRHDPLPEAANPENSRSRCGFVLILQHAVPNRAKASLWILTHTIDTLPSAANVRVYATQFDSDKVIAMKTPHQLSDEAIEEFKTAYHDEVGISLSQREASALAFEVLQLFALLSTPAQENSEANDCPQQSN